ncbi:hypothetical protein Pelo_6280 [Pelomyxa schiedti]|nr:hypothetical protein Pelo_6280 [Pelomyxa schiedti]
MSSKDGSTSKREQRRRLATAQRDALRNTNTQQQQQTQQQPQSQQQAHTQQPQPQQQQQQRHRNRQHHHDHDQQEVPHPPLNFLADCLPEGFAPSVDDFMAVYSMMQASGADLPPPRSISTFGPDGNCAKFQPSVLIDARRQYLALAAACNPRCGSRSAARLMSTITGHLFGRLWVDWIQGTHLTFSVSVWKIPGDEADNESHIPQSQKQAVIGQAERFMGNLSLFQISALTLGVVRLPLDLVDDSAIKVDMGRSVGMIEPPTVVLCDVNLGRGRRQMTICDESSIPTTNISHLVANNDWVVLAAGWHTIGVVDINRERLEPRWATKRQIHPGLVTLGDNCILRLDFFLGEPMVTYIKDDGSGDIMFCCCAFSPAESAAAGVLVSEHSTCFGLPHGGDIMFCCCAFSPAESAAAGVLVSEHSTCFGLPHGFPLETVARLRKRGGECILIVGTDRPDTQNKFIEVPEGHSASRSNRIKNINTMGTDLVTISDSLFGLYSPCSAATSHLFEVWDCNDTSKPLKVIHLATQFVLPGAGVPPSAAAVVKRNQMRKVEALYGFLFHWVDRKLYVIDARSELTVLTLELPREEDTSGAWVPGLHVWSPGVTPENN